MNLWRRSKSWFQDNFPAQKENFEPQDYLEQEKQLVKAKYDHERAIIQKQFHYELLEAKLRFESELSRLQDEHSRLKAKSRPEIENKEPVNGTGSPVKDGKIFGKDFKSSPVKNNVENGLDGLEWDPVNELYDENATNSWEAHDEVSPNGSFEEEDKVENPESRDSAYGSISMELQSQSFNEEKTIVRMKQFNANDIERKVDELRNNIRREIAREYEEKFQSERKFLYSVIDELEENVALLRKQKEDIVTIFEAQGK